MVSMAPDDIAACNVPVATPGFGAPDCAAPVPPLPALPELPLPLPPQAESRRGTAAASAAPPLTQLCRGLVLVMSISDPLASASCACLVSLFSLLPAWMLRVCRLCVSLVSPAGDAPQPRIERGVQEVDNGVREHGDQRSDDDHAGDDRVIEVLDRAEACVAKARNGKDRLDEEHPGQRGCDVRAEQDGHGRSDIAADVPYQNPRSRGAFRHRGAGVVLGQLLGGERPDEADVDGGEANRQRDPRQDEVVSPLNRTLAEVYVANDGEERGPRRQQRQAEDLPRRGWVAEEVGDHRREPEHRNRHAEDGNGAAGNVPGGPRVLPAISAPRR